MIKDWTSPWWQACLLPDVWDVCGIRVPSLSVWLTFALEQIGNCYLLGGATDRDDAASLLLFASNDYATGKRLVLDESMRARELLSMHKALKRVDWSELHSACVDYTTSCLHTARRFQKADKGGKLCAVPYQWHIVARLSAGHPDAIVKAWNTPYATARCIFDAIAESSGDDSIMRPEYQKMDDEAVLERESAQCQP